MADIVSYPKPPPPDPTTFGRALIQTLDLDPVYVGLYHLRLPPARQARWLIAYWLTYHVGVASRLSEAERFWDWVSIAAANRNRDWPRGRERRHWRGDAATDSATLLAALYPDPEDLIRFATGGGIVAHTMIRRVMELPQFGPWIAFKAVDMLERCSGVDVRWDQDTILMYRTPREGAMAAGQLWGCTAEEALRRVVNDISAFPAPPDGRRPCGFPEAETILCKWKSGHYRIGEDIDAVRRMCDEWGQTAREFRWLLEREMDKCNT